MARTALVNDARKDPILNPVNVRDVATLRQVIRRGHGGDLEPLPDGERVDATAYAPLNAWDEGIRYWLPIRAERPVHDVPQRSYGHAWMGPNIKDVASCSRCGATAQTTGQYVMTDECGGQ